MSRLPTVPLILLVDDSEEVRIAYTRYLTASGFRVETAIGGADGLAKVRSHRPDLVLMDISMPDMDGFEATRQIKADPSLAAVPVLLHSAHVFEELESKAAEVGAHGFLQKPFESDDLVRTVARILGERSQE